NRSFRSIPWKIWNSCAKKKTRFSPATVGSTARAASFTFRSIKPWQSRSNMDSLPERRSKEKHNEKRSRPLKVLLCLFFFVFFSSRRVLSLLLGFADAGGSQSDFERDPI